MAKQTINLGTAPNAGDGDPIREGGQKINDNFDELYNSLNLDAQYTYFPIWAEDSGTVQTGTRLSYGNGDETPDGSGIVMGVDCELFALGGEAENATGGTNIAADKNSVQVATSGVFSGTTGQNSTGMNILGTPIAYEVNDIFNFTVVAASGSSIRTVAWFRVPIDVSGIKGDKGDTGLTGTDISALYTVTANSALSTLWAGGIVECDGTTASSSLEITIPLNSTDPFPVLTSITFYQEGVDKVEIVAEAGVTLKYHIGLRTQGTNSTIQVVQLKIDTWLVIGGGV